MNKEIHFGNESRLRLKKGIDTVANAVKVTLGAKGRNVVITAYGGRPHVTKDGVTVARSIFVNDPIENMGASMVKEAARKAVDIAGDGTTTACVLVQAMVNKGLESINKAGSVFDFFSKDTDTDKSINPVEIKEGIDFATKAVCDYLKQQSVPVKDLEAVKNIATISANNDAFIGNMIYDAYKQVGMEGLVTIEEAKSNETTLEVSEGLLINRGFLNSGFVNNMSKMKSELVDPCVLITDTTIRSFEDIKTVCTYCAQQTKALVIIAEDVQGEALSTLILNMQKRSFISCVIKAPAYGEERKAILEDIAIATGAKIVSTGAGKLLRKIIPSEHLGSAGKIITDKDSCIIVKGGGDEQKVEDRKKQLRENKDITGGIEKTNIERRLANLGNGVAIIKVGGITETEMKERKDRIEDALLATRAAIEEGYVVGGGVALCKASLLKIKSDSPNVQTGINIVLNAIREPFRQILLNGGVNPEGVVISLESNVGYNIKTNTREDFIKSGVIDPVKVTRVALESAASIAGIFLTTECVIAEPQLAQQQ